MDRKDYIRDLLRVHDCIDQCAPYLIVSRHLRVARRDTSHLVLPIPFAYDHFAWRTQAAVQLPYHLASFIALFFCHDSNDMI